MKIPPNELVFYMMAGATLSLFVAFIINIFSKLSLHTLAAGNLLALCLVMMRYSTYDLRFLFVAMILLSGIIGVSRLILEAHTEKEVVTGYLAGFFCQFLAFSIVPRIF